VEKEQIISGGLLELYVIGAASAEEVAQVELWKTQFPEISEEINKIEISLEQFAMANAVEPDESVKKVIFSTVKFNDSAYTNGDNDKIKAKVFSISPAWRSVAAAAMVILAGSIVLNILFYNRYKSADDNYFKSKEQLALQQQKLDEMNTDMTVVQNKYSKAVSLNGLEAAPDAAAKIFWIKNTGETYIDPSNLPEAPKGMQYQLWAIIDGKPVDGGMIKSAEGKNYRIQKMKTFGKVQAFAVTLETAGGNPTPKGKMFVMGEI
jgi:anti-sigma-K factor RskA